MSGLNVENFNLFAKKAPAHKPAPRPVVIEQELEKSDAEIETPIIQAAPVMEAAAVEIERFEEVRPTQILTTQVERPIQIQTKIQDKNKGEAPLRKFETFVAPTFRIPEQHDLDLKKIEHVIMRNRKKGANLESRERITTNSVVRALIANFLDRVVDVDFSNIDNEEMLKERMEKVFKQKYIKRT